MGLSSLTLSLEGVAFSKLSKTHIMFRFVALFALVAVAAAEPQWGYPYIGVHHAAHLKTPSGDTVSVQAAKVQHHQLKAAEYAKKAYVPYTYASNVVAAPVASAVYSAPATYAAATVPVTYAAAPAYTHGAYIYNTAGVYGTYPYSTYGYAHHLGKRDADSQYYTTNAYTRFPYYNNVYNTAGVYGAPIYNTAGVYGRNVYNNVYGGWY